MLVTRPVSNQTMALIKDMAKKDLEKSDEEVKPVSNVVSETEEDLPEEDQRRETEAEESFASIESEGGKSDDQSVGLGEATLAEIRFRHCLISLEKKRGLSWNRYVWSPTYDTFNSFFFCPVLTRSCARVALLGHNSPIYDECQTQ